MLKTQNHVLGVTTANMPITTDVSNFLLPISLPGAPWQKPKATSGVDKIAFVLTEDVFSAPRKLEIIHARVMADGLGLYNIDRGMEGTTKQLWPVGTHVVSVVTEATLAQVRGDVVPDELWKEVSVADLGYTGSGAAINVKGHWEHSFKNAPGYTPTRFRRMANGLVEIQAHVKMPLKWVPGREQNLRSQAMFALPPGYNPSSEIMIMGVGEPTAWGGIYTVSTAVGIGVVPNKVGLMLAVPTNQYLHFNAVYYADR